MEYGGKKMKAFTVWLTGIPSSGKSSIAFSLQNKLKELNIPVEVLDSDVLRKNIHKNLSYTEEDRGIFYMSIIFIAKLLGRNNINVIIAATANRRRYRDRAREQFKNFIEVYVRCPVEICIKRDQKRFYEDAMKGEIQTFPIFISENDDPLNNYVKDRTIIKKLFPTWGIYEKPKNPDCVVDTSINGPEKNAEIILKLLRDRGFINPQYSGV